MLFENDIDDDSGYSLEMGWLCSEIADDWQVLFRLSVSLCLAQDDTGQNTEE